MTCWATWSARLSLPMRSGYADRVYVITSGENMAIHAAANIAMAIEGSGAGATPSWAASS